jgi:hypothetical protein
LLLGLVIGAPAKQVVSMTAGALLGMTLIILIAPALGLFDRQKSDRRGWRMLFQPATAERRRAARQAQLWLLLGLTFLAFELVRNAHRSA